VFVGHVKGIVYQLVEIVPANLFVTDIDLSGKAWKVNIDPVGIFRFVLKKGGILQNISIHRVFECIGIAGLIEQLVFMFGKIDLKVTSGPGGVGTVTGHYRNKQNNKGNVLYHKCFHLKIIIKFWPDGTYHGKVFFKTHRIMKILPWTFHSIIGLLLAN
jgi:hypothetical protein